ncbi:MAG: DNA-binding protein Alba [Candidatus Bathyarchaeia archaeon]
MTEEKPKEGRSAKNVQQAQVGETTVLVGKKPVMNYVIACLTFFNSGAKKVVVKARGRAISRAVDTVELLRRAFLKDLQLQEINIYTEEVTRSEGQKTNVSAIEITLTRP